MPPLFDHIVEPYLVQVSSVAVQEFGSGRPCMMLGVWSSDGQVFMSLDSGLRSADTETHNLWRSGGPSEARAQPVGVSCAGRNHALLDIVHQRRVDSVSLVLSTRLEE